MPEVAVGNDDRPSIAKYVIFTAIGILLLNGFVAMVLQDSTNPVIALGGVFLASVGSIAIGFVMIQSLIEEWFTSAEIIDE